MSDVKDVLSGKVLLTDTKVRNQVQPKAGTGKIPNPAQGTMPHETNPHKLFTARVIQEKLKKKEVVAHLQKFCDQEDAKL